MRVRSLFVKFIVLFEVAKGVFGHEMDKGKGGI